MSTIPDVVRFHTAAKDLDTGKVSLANGPSDTGWLDADLAAKETSSYAACEVKECEIDRREPREEFFVVTAVTSYAVGSEPTKPVFDVEYKAYENNAWGAVAVGCLTADQAFALMDDLAGKSTYRDGFFRVVESRRTPVERPTPVAVS